MSKDRAGRASEAGFSLAEVLVAIVILVVGLMAVTNLMLVGVQSNAVAHRSTGAVSQAVEVLERLKAIPFTSLTPGGNLDTDAGTVAGCSEATAASGCVIPGNFNSLRGVPGLGDFKTRWQITAVDAATLYIVVRSESTGALTRRLSRVEMATFRSCTASSIGCP